MVADRSQPFVGLFREDPVDRMEEVCVGALSGATDPPAQLVELTETEQVRPVHHQGVDHWHVDPRFDDRRADEDVVGALPEVEHDLLERALVHLAVRDRDPRLGRHVLHALRYRVDVLDPVVDVEDLALS